MVVGNWLVAGGWWLVMSSVFSLSSPSNACSLLPDSRLPTPH
ncbi:hypothetical protein [Scytonema millei]|nr:hypothetical protein [Scytonema millei]